MSTLTSPEQRAALATQHLRTLARTAGGTRRDRIRLALLRLMARRYHPHPPFFAPSPRRIVVIRPDHLGDLLFVTPALSALRRRYPTAHIAALVGPWGAPVLVNNPDIDELLTCPFPGFTRQPKDHPLGPYTLLREEAARLASRRFDLALVLRFDHWWGAWLAAEAGIQRRVGYDIPSTRLFLTDPCLYVAGLHEVEQNLMLAESEEWGLGEGDWRAPSGDWRLRSGTPAKKYALSFAMSTADKKAAEELLTGLDRGRPLIAIHPGSGAAVKQWRTEGWLALARALIEQPGAQVVFTGSADESSLIDPVLAGLTAEGSLARSVRSLVGRTDLGALAAVYRRCTVVVGPDCGPLHLAVAVGRPTVHLYGPVDQRTFGPWGDPARHVVLTSDWPCIACNKLDWPDAALAEHGCVRDIAVEDVLAAVRGQLNSAAT